MQRVIGVVADMSIVAGSVEDRPVDSVIETSRRFNFPAYRLTILLHTQSWNYLQECSRKTMRVVTGCYFY